MDSQWDQNNIKTLRNITKGIRRSDKPKRNNISNYIYGDVARNSVTFKNVEERLRKLIKLLIIDKTNTKKDCVFTLPGRWVMK